MAEEQVYVQVQTGQTVTATPEEFENSLKTQGYRLLDEPDMEAVENAPEAPQPLPEQN